MKNNSVCLRLVLSTLVVTASVLLIVPEDAWAASAGSRASASSATRSAAPRAPSKPAASTSGTAAKPVTRPSGATKTPKPGFKPSAKSGTPVKTPKQPTSAGKQAIVVNAVPPSSDSRFGGTQSKAELQKTRDNYNAQVLKGQPDPYKKLMADSDKKSVAGPPGSNLAAMVKVRPSVGTAYRREANQELANNAALQRELTTRFSRETGDLRGQFVPPQRNRSGQYSNPYLQRPDGSKVELEWHHSPNHVGTVSLIPKTTHRLGEGGMERLHYIDPQTSKAQGGDNLYTVPRQPAQPAAQP